MRRTWLAAVGGTCVCAVACNLVFGIEEREHDPALDDAGRSSDASPDVTDAAKPLAIGTPSCAGNPPGPDAGVCSTFEHLTKPITIDGIAEEYCDLHATVFRVIDGKLLLPEPTDGGPIFDETVRIFATWSTEGLALHAHVDDRTVHAGATPQKSDALTFYVGMGPPTATTGALTADNVVVIVSPPTASVPARALLIKDGLEPTWSDAASRQVKGGYEIELLVTWKNLGLNSAPNANTAQLKFDLSVSVDNGSGVQLVSFLEDKPVGGITPCAAPSTANPTCDTRTWCTAKLAP